MSKVYVANVSLLQAGWAVTGTGNDKAGDLSSGASVVTDKVRVCGSDSVSWFTSCGPLDTDLLNGVVVELSETGLAGSWLPATGALGANVVTTGSLGAMNVAPSITILQCQQTTRRLPWNFARLNITNGAGIITGFKAIVKIQHSDVGAEIVQAPPEIYSPA